MFHLILHRMYHPTQVVTIPILPMQQVTATKVMGTQDPIPRIHQIREDINLGAEDHHHHLHPTLVEVHQVHRDRRTGTVTHHIMATKYLPTMGTHQEDNR
jgi:hypothetical protein